MATTAAEQLLQARLTSGLRASTAGSELGANKHHKCHIAQGAFEAAASSIQAYSPSQSGHSSRKGLAASPVTLSARSSAPRSAEPIERRRILGRLSPSATSAPAAEGSVGDANTASAPAGMAQLTWLENNGWIWEVAGVRMLVDPWLVGELDFDIPAFYSAKKRATRDLTVAGLPPLDAVLITQSLDDHCHMKTLRELAKARPTLPVIAPPSAQKKLEPLFKNLTLLRHHETHSVSGANGSSAVTVRATPGDLVGPPWQPRENGYIVASTEPAFSLYYEPHCKAEGIREDEQVDCVITPSVSQKILGYTLVAGEEQAVQLARQLKARYIVPMLNGDLEATGLLSLVVQEGSSATAFKELASPEFVVLTPEPGKPLSVPPSTES